jgi:GTP 3',8-cyclase
VKLSPYIAAVQHQVVDVYGRTFKTLRVSLTDACNFGCSYCVEGNAKSLRKPRVLGIELAQAIRSLHQLLDFDTIRFTGGEPTLYPDLVPLVQALTDLQVPLKMTTNGYLLSKLAQPLHDAGLQSLNVSLDAVDAVVFQKMARKDALSEVLNGIDAALDLGIELKINTVVVNGQNEGQVLPLLEYGMERQIPIRFLELMRMGHLFSPQFDGRFFSQANILETIASRYAITPLSREASSTANYWALDNGYRFGIIANESQPFCHDCDRLRLDSNGQLFGCLSEKKPVSVLHALDDEEQMVDLLRLTLSHKQPLKFIGSPLTMIGIGG